MFDHVIAGFDGHDGGRDAIALAAALRPRQLTLVMAYGADSFVLPTVTTDYWQTLHEDAERRLDAVRTEAQLDADVLAIPDPSPARALHDAAERLEADLIVVGSAHHGRLGRMVLGDVGRGVLHGAPCPVAVAPRRFAERARTPRRIAVAYDGSVEARHALAVAADAVRAGEGELLVCTVWEEPTMVIAAFAYMPDIQHIAGDNEEAARRVLDEAVASVDVPVHGLLLHGSARHALSHAVQDADLIVLGSRGWGAGRRVILGSTSDAVVHHAACPVVVVPRPAAASSDPSPAP